MQAHCYICLHSELYKCKVSRFSTTLQYCRLTSQMWVFGFCFELLCLRPVDSWDKLQLLVTLHYRTKQVQKMDGYFNEKELKQVKS